MNKLFLISIIIILTSCLIESKAIIKSSNSFHEILNPIKIVRPKILKASPYLRIDELSEKIYLKKKERCSDFDRLHNLNGCINVEEIG